MLRIYFLQQWFNLSDLAVEEALYDSVVMRQFAGIDLGCEPVPDETTACKFRHLLEEHGLGGKILETVNQYLQSKVGLATYFGPLAEVNSGPAAEAYWTGFGVEDAMCSGLKRSESPVHIECDRSACFLTPAFSTVRRKR